MTTHPTTEMAVSTDLLGRYRLIRELGKGGMGTVFLARHVTIDKPVAIKILAAEYADRPELRARFLQEARSASRIGHENVVDISDFGDTPDGSVFLVMELLDGEDLSRTIASGPIPWARTKHLVLQICRALAAAHDAGVVHRDMKPENVFRIRRGSDRDFVKVLDFGIAKVDAPAEHGPREPGPRLTKTGMIMGTPEYMSPEQASGLPVDARSDIYALGVILFEMLTLRVPFEGSTFMAVLSQHMFDKPVVPSQVAPWAGIPPELDAIVLKALQKEPRHRFASMHDMAAAIEAVGSGTGAVEVIDEDVTAPSEGVATTFASRVVRESQAHTLWGIESPPRRRTSPLAVVGVAALGIALAVGGVLAVTYYRKNAEHPADPPTKQAPLVATNDVLAGPERPNEPEPEPESEPDATPPTSERVTITISTKVPAKILDAADEAILGSIPGDPIVVDRADEPLVLIVRAAGHEDFEIRVVPDGDKQFEPTLVLESTKGKKKKPKRQPDGTPEVGKTEGVVELDASPNPTPTEKYVPPELRNPFGKGKKKKSG